MTLLQQLAADFAAALADEITRDRSTALGLLNVAVSAAASEVSDMVVASVQGIKALDNLPFGIGNTLKTAGEGAATQFFTGLQAQIEARAPTWIDAGIARLRTYALQVGGQEA